MILPPLQSLDDGLRLLALYRRPALLAGMLFLVALALLLMVVPPRYSSNASLLIKPGREDVALPVEIMNRPVVSTPAGLRDDMLDEKALITSDRVVSAVAAQIGDGLAAADAPAGLLGRLRAGVKAVLRAIADAVQGALATLRLADQVTPEQALKERLSRRLGVGYEDGSEVLQLSFSWRDPTSAQAILDVWVEQFLAARAQLMERDSVRAFYRERVDASEQRLAGLQAELSALRQAMGALDAGAAVRALGERIAGLETERDDLRADLAGLDARLTEIRARLATLPAEVVERRERDLNPAVEDLRREILSTRLERRALLHDFEPEADAVRRLDAGLAELQSWLASEPERITRTESFAPNALAQDLTASLQQHQVAHAHQSAELKTKDRQLVQLVAERERLIALQDRVESLERRLGAEDELYWKYLASLQQAEVDDALDRERISNVAVLQPPSFDPGRSFPPTLPILAATPLVLLAVMGLTAYVTAVADPRVRDARALAHAFDIPVLAELPAAAEPDPDAGLVGYRALWLALDPAQVPAAGRCIGFAAWRLDAAPAQPAEAMATLCTDAGVSAQVLTGPVPAAAGTVHFGVLPPLEAAAPGELRRWRHCDDLILVVRADHSTFAEVASAHQLLRQAGGERFRGAVVTAVRGTSGHWSGTLRSGRAEARV